MQPSDVSRLRESIANVVKIACDCNASSADFPEEWLFHKRWGKGKDGTKTKEGHHISFITVSGRTSAVVVEMQGSRGLKKESASSRKSGATADQKNVLKARAPKALESRRVSKRKLD